MIKKMRLEKDLDFKSSPKSPMAGAQRITLKAGEKTFVLARLEGIHTSDKKEIGAVFTLESKDGKWTWTALDDRITCHAGRKAVKSGSHLQDSGSLHY